jgi:antitoxin component YwqK of YwqJK toxin-antitoxin module
MRPPPARGTPSSPQGSGFPLGWAFILFVVWLVGGGAALLVGWTFTPHLGLLGGALLVSGPALLVPWFLTWQLVRLLGRWRASWTTRLVLATVVLGLLQFGGAVLLARETGKTPGEVAQSATRALDASGAQAPALREWLASLGPAPVAVPAVVPGTAGTGTPAPAPSSYDAGTPAVVQAPEGVGRTDAGALIDPGPRVVTITELPPPAPTPVEIDRKNPFTECPPGAVRKDLQGFSRCELSHGMYHGPWVAFSGPERLATDFNEMKNGVTDGRVIRWDDRGQAWETRCIDGLPDGPFIERNYGFGGYRMVTFQRGVPHGLYAEWNGLGKVTISGQYVNGAPEGPWFWRASNGVVLAEGSYQGGPKFGCGTLLSLASMAGYCSGYVPPLEACDPRNTSSLETSWTNITYTFAIHGERGRQGRWIFRDALGVVLHDGEWKDGEPLDPKVPRQRGRILDFPKTERVMPGELSRVKPTAMLACPVGARKKGSAPPGGFDEWCERPDGKRHGPRLQYDADGNVIASMEYMEGARHGEVVILRKGLDQARGRCWKGKPDGEWVIGRGDRKREVVTWKEGVLHGPFHQWTVTGMKSAEGQFVEGQPQGQWTYFYETGFKFHEGAYDGGGLACAESAQRNFCVEDIWRDTGCQLGRDMGPGIAAGRKEGRTGEWKEWRTNGHLLKTSRWAGGKEVLATEAP